MNDEFRLIAAQLHDVQTYQMLFVEPDERAIKATYRKILKVVHPDRVASDYQAEANDLVGKLARLYDAALTALHGGSFGSTPPLLVFESSVMRHECSQGRTRYFDMTTGYDAITHSEHQTPSLLKIARVPRDNELLATEADALTRLAASGDEHAMFYPTLLDSFAVSDGKGRLRANVLTRLDGFVNLEQVYERYPDGIHPLDMGWMWRRVLWALGGAHELGVVHGALVPSHIMIHPTLHGVVLVDWCYSVQRCGDSYPAIKAIVGARRSWYPERIVKRRPATESLDITLAARSMQYITDTSRQPGDMRRYFDRLTTGTHVVSAFELLAQFDQLLERLGAPYYPRTYRPFTW